MAAGLARELLLSEATLCFAAFAVGLYRHFNVLRAMPVGMRLTLTASLLGFLAFWVHLLRHPAASTWWLAAFLLAASLALFTWAVRSSPRRRLSVAFDDRRPDFVLRRGAYAFVRHPFYASYMLFWLALGVARLDVLGLMFTVGMISLYRSAALMEERRFVGSALAGCYAAYRRATGRFVPRLRLPLG